MTLKEFLKKHGYTLPETTDGVLNSRLEKVYWDGAQGFDLVMLTNEPYNQFDFFVNLLKEKFPDASFALHCHPIEDEPFDLMKELCAMIPGASAFGDPIVHDENIEIPVTNGLLYQTLSDKRVAEQLEEMARNHLSPCKISFFLEEESGEDFFVKQQQIAEEKVKSLGDKIDQASRQKKSDEKIKQIRKDSSLRKKEYRNIDAIHVED